MSGIGLHILGVFFSSLLISLFSVPLIKKITTHLRIVDHPSERKIHTKPISLLGGIGICLGVLGTLALWPAAVSFSSPGILIGAICILLLGILDDVCAIEAKWKLLGQICIAAIPVSQGLQLTQIAFPFIGIFHLGILSIPLTIFFMIGLINTINLIDGLDGLAAGISLIAAATLCIVSFYTGNILTVMSLVACIGATLGFLRYNFPPAQIFMGDSGSMFLGYILALASIQGVLQGCLSWKVGLPLMVLAIPILDMLYAIVRRARNKQAIFKPDKDHFHHKLLRLGLSQKQIAIFSYLITAFLGVLAIGIFFSKGIEQCILGITSGVFIGSGLYILKKKKPVLTSIIRNIGA